MKNRRWVEISGGFLIRTQYHQRGNLVPRLAYLSRRSDHPGEVPKMFQLFLRARAKNYFKARSADRDTETDHARASSIFRLIEDALEASKAEHAGLTSRINDALARAAVTMGNDSDEYLTRDPEDNHYQNLLGAEIANGQRRLNELKEAIGHFKFLRVALITRFPGVKPRTEPQETLGK
jgi:hypothetical protein